MRHATVLLAAAAMVSWGLWVVFARIAGQTMVAETVLVVTYFVGGVVGLAAVSVRDTSPAVTSTALAAAVASGLCFGLGGLAYYAALRRGSTAVPTAIAALYFVVASLLAVVLFGESLGLRDSAGLLLAAGAIVLLAT